MPSSVSYRLKRFETSRDPDFPAALLLYVRNTPSNVRADTNEITYWIDNFVKAFKDDFYVFGFYRNKFLVGYAQAAYFRQERLFALDYIAIDEKQRGNGVFHEFVDQLREYMENAHPEYRYGLAEVTYNEPRQKAQSTESHLLVRLFKLQGFRIIRAPYYQPRVMLDDPESEVEGDLLIYSKIDLETLKKETYLGIVNTIYFKHYLRWKNIFPDTQAQYEKYLNDLYRKIETSIGKKSIIMVNGHKSILKPPGKRPVVTLHRFIWFAFQGLLIIILLAAAMFGLKSLFGLSDYTFIIFYIMAIASFMGVVGIVSKEAREMFSEILELTKFLLSKRENDLTPIEKEKRRSLPKGPEEP